MSIIQSKMLDLYRKYIDFIKNWPIFHINRPFLINLVRIRIKIVATIDRTAGIESQKSIKCRFEYDLDRISSRPRSNRISLLHSLLQGGLRRFTAIKIGMVIWYLVYILKLECFPYFRHYFERPTNSNQPDQGDQCQLHFSDNCCSSEGGIWK